MSNNAIQVTVSRFGQNEQAMFVGVMDSSDVEASPSFEALQISGVAPNIIREL